MSDRHAGLILGAVLALTAVTLIGGTAWNLASVEVPSTVAMPTGGALETGTRAPDLRLGQVGGDSLSLADLRGQVVVIAFWATWSEPSRQQVAALQSLAGSFDDQDVAVIALNLDRERELIVPDVQRLGLQIPVLYASIAEQLRYRVTIVPTLYVLDTAGFIRHRHAGYLPGMEEALTFQINALLGDD